MLQKYCKSRNFRDNSIFANSVKRQTCDVKNSRLWHDFSKSVIDRVISQGFYFRENCTLAKISEFTVECSIGLVNSKVVDQASRSFSDSLKNIVLHVFQTLQHYQTSLP